MLSSLIPNVSETGIARVFEEERGVHGGEYSVRPGKQESMVFLRKLFTHQQTVGNAFAAQFSPPDGPMRAYLVCLFAR